MDLLELISPDTELKRVAATHGGEYHGPCPQCGGRDRFVVWPKQGPHGRFWCRQCGINGDDVDYLTLIKGMNIRQAMETYRRSGPHPQRYTASVDQRIPDLSKDSYEFSDSSQRTLPAKDHPEDSAEIWQTQARMLLHEAEKGLWTDAGRQARDYLHTRGLKEETIRAAGLGFIEQDRRENYSAWGLDNGNQVWIPGPSVVIPKMVGEKFYGVKFRRLTADEPKYTQIRNSQTLLYGVDRAADFRYLVLTEGEFDCMLLRQEAGDLVAVATLGSATEDRFPPHAFPVIMKLDLVLIAYDSDSAGTKGSVKLHTRYPGLTRILTKPGPGDLTDFHRAGNSLRAWLLDELADQGVYDYERAAIQQYDGGVSAQAIDDAMWAALKRDHINRPCMIKS